ncbi:asparaginase [Candidatus Woesearchaeota archaeon]|nr:asparaginase [Candidatus Woesearchaeota archaeon]
MGTGLEQKIVHFMHTGGTIDSEFDGDSDGVALHKNSIIPVYFQKLGILDTIVSTQICMKQSTDIGAPERQRLLAAIESSHLANFVVTHGLYTIKETGEFLAEKLATGPKTVVLTGSRYPLSDVAMSDAPFQLGHALSEVKHLPSGVYICLNGRTARPADYKT